MRPKLSVISSVRFNCRKRRKCHVLADGDKWLARRIDQYSLKPCDPILAGV